MAMATLQIRESTRPSGRIDERALARLWQNAHRLSEGLEAEDGRRFRVVYPGRSSGLAGPDFRDSVLETETGELLMGDVELHVNAPDWYSHGHHRDPGYNGVVLHVVLHARSALDSLQQSGTRAVVASLGPAVGRLAGDHGRGEEAPSPLPSLDGGGLERVLDVAGDRRFLGRAKRFALEMVAVDPGEVAYRALMEGLGYAANRAPFMRLARAVPLSMLRRLAHEPHGTRLLAVQSLLLRAAGLDAHDDSARPVEETRALLRRLPGTPRLQPQEWRVSGVRPANHPARRVVGAAHILDRHLQSGLLEGLAEAVAERSARAVIDRLQARPYVGEGRARELAVNAALPATYAWGGIRRDRALQDAALALYREFPGLGDNGITREMKRLLSADDRGVDVKGARRQQGLLHLYRGMKGSAGDGSGQRATAR